ncbi:hypothetical protein GmHk_13G036281 [Glycine max]|nr:hypothetical protein GmHk_13G036281 [Glycine max]
MKSLKIPLFLHVVVMRRIVYGVIVMAVQLIHDRVEMECLEGAWETLEGNARCRFRGTIRFTATSLAHPDEPVRTLQRTMEWILPTLTSYRLVEPVQVIEVTSSEEDPEEDPEELPPEPAVDTLDFLEGDEDPLHFLRWILPRKSCRHLRQTLRRIVARERWRPVEALHHSGQFHGLEFDDCIHVAEATTVDTFALDDTMYFVKLPYFG